MRTAGRDSRPLNEELNRAELMGERVEKTAVAVRQLYSLLNQELPAHVLPGLQADLALNVPPPAPKAASNLPAWPNTLPEQVRAVAQVLTTAPRRPATGRVRGQLQRQRPVEKRPAPHSGNAGNAGRARREGSAWRS